MTQSSVFRYFLFALFMAAATGAKAQVQSADPVLGENAVRVSPHVFMISAFPNVIIVTGSAGTLVVDTGLGPKNGATAARVAAKLARGPKLYLTTTHFHPEHASGEAGFPAGTILIRAKAQQDELVADNNQMLTSFQSRPAFAPLLQGVTFRTPDILFDRSYDLDLGDVHVTLIYAGPAHTRGDEEVFVKEDSVLITGDVVQNRTGPIITAIGVGPRDWLAAVKALAPRKPRLIIPDHSVPGDGMTLIAQEENFMQSLDDEAHALKAKGLAVDQATARITADLKMKFPDWTLRDLTPMVTRAYAEN